ncbi:rhamnulokinase [Paenibacillus filicis]|uniref:Rhamnulokinase n=1 Tax=Paenibacillus gyeongsangnamensis TaxID=3388067 RepID=A0ABT4Q521_9BACL|nr:rhamnulokinase family protein [Paenibacillus filicis]MCZ8511965.1 rhamnulokinase [Paenibacillus filicis]
MVSRTAQSVLAIDLGAGSGRAVIGRLTQGGGPDDLRLSMEEIHRFPNDPVRVGKHLHWDILRLLHEIKQAILKAVQLEGDRLGSIAIDSWAVDFGLIGTDGQLLGNPYHYRDHHTDGVMEEVCARLGRERIFAASGLQFLQFNTIYQLAALQAQQPGLMDRADKLLMIPDLLRYFLTGEMHSEYTNASTTQLLNPVTRTWDAGLLSDLGLSPSLLLPPQASGIRAGTLSPEVCAELGVPPIPVVTVGEHDTASAVVAVPAEGKDFAYLSCGTWSLLGTELPAPVLTEQALTWNFTNEGGVQGTTRLLKNIMGLWLVQESRRAWEKAGSRLSFPQLVQAAESAAPFVSFIDPDDDAFLNPGHMPEAIQAYCARTGQPVPASEGEIIRCVLESLALKYRFVLERTERLTGKRFDGLHMVGGGIQNSLLCRFTANALQRPVWAGPVEGSAIGNIVVQYMALGVWNTLHEARQVIRSSFPVRTYSPENVDGWAEAYERFRGIIGE